ncbi:MAG: DEAD/DEAH box helicase family protein [Chloroflexi bacterium]|nr:DEAD/DEAH box helicase family protein [Chloroflexota bacterium]
MISDLASAGDKVCVSLDLETTGLAAETDEIIEVGAVRFQGDRVLDTLHTLVNPYRPLPQFIKELTGITQAEVDTGPAFATVAPLLESFIGNWPIVGQNVGFDLGFLAKKGLRLSNPYYDTLEMASVLLPRQREYSLAPLAASLGIEHANPHRALGDAQVTAQVFQALKGVAMGMDEAMLSELGRLYARARGHLASLFLQLQVARGQETGLKPSATGLLGLDVEMLGKRLDSSAALRPQGEYHSLDEESVAGFFQEGGPLAQVLESYHYRPQQAEMARAVARAFESKRTLVVEGGTGVGKSMAYLLPALLFALENGARVVVSTNTINLQEQLIAKDLPTLSRALKEWSPNLAGVRFSLLKGRDNYLCLRRWRQLIREESLSPEEARMAAKVMVWLQNTSSGDRAEMNVASRDMPLWSRMSAAGAVDCPPRARGEVCFLRAAREQAEAAHLVVVNHALLMRDLVEGGGIIPSYDYLVIDEAHHLEEEATSQLGSRLSQGAMEEYLKRLEGDRGLYRVMRAFMGQLLAAPRAAVLEPLIQDGEALLPRVREHTGTLWATLATFLRHHHDEGDARHLLHSVTRSSRTQPEWSQVEIAWENADLALSQVARNLERLAQALDGLEDKQLAGYDSLCMEVSSCLSAAGDIREKLRSFIIHPEDDQIYWMTQEGMDGEVALNAAPLQVGSILQEKLFSRKESVVLTSATLSTQGNFRHISERLGLEDADELLVDSPFDYPRAVLLCIPRDMPDPTSRSYQEALQRAMIDVCRAAGGRTMGLFTSHAALQATRSGIREELEGRGFKVLAQGVDGPPRSLLEIFLQRPSSVLLGTSSFWEGVDIPGGALKALVVARLPFNVPTEPVFAARSQLFEDPFNQYAVPQSVLRFRQGFGRLIRGEEDRGVVVVLDQRILSRRYGPVFLESLPGCTVMKGSLRELSQAVKQWIASAP